MVSITALTSSRGITSQANLLTFAADVDGRDQLLSVEREDGQGVLLVVALGGSAGDQVVLEQVLEVRLNLLELAAGLAAELVELDQHPLVLEVQDPLQLPELQVRDLLPALQLLLVDARELLHLLRQRELAQVFSQRVELKCPPIEVLLVLLLVLVELENQQRVLHLVLLVDVPVVLVDLGELSNVT